MCFSLSCIGCETQETDLLSSPDVVRDYLRLMLGDRPHEVFAVVFLNAQNQVIATEEVFRGTLTQSSVRQSQNATGKILKTALKHQHPK